MMISKGPSGLRRAGLEGGTHLTHHHQVSLGLSLPRVGAMAEGSGPSGPHQQVFQKQTARGRVAGRPTAKGPSLLFGKALWPAPGTDLGGVEVGRSQCVAQAEAGNRERTAPALPPSSSCQATLSSGRGLGRRHVARAGGAPGPATVPAWDPALRAANKEGGASSLAISPTERINGGQAEGGRTPHRGPPSPRSKPGSHPALQPALYRFSPGWYWGSVDVK